MILSSQFFLDRNGVTPPMAKIMKEELQVIIIVTLDLEEIELKFTNDVVFNFENKCINV